MPATKPWKTRLYDEYVSSGQAADARRATGAPEAFFRPREAHIRQIIARHLPKDKQARIADLGCGHGAFLYFLSRMGYTRIAGVDISPQQVELARRLGITQAEVGEIAVFLSQRENASLDAVLLMDIIEHLTNQELFDLLDSVCRVLVPGGVCLVHVPNAEGLYGMRVRYGDFTHELAFTRQSADQIFRTIGFSTVQAYEDKPVIHGIKSTCRRVLWDGLTLYDRLLLLAETGSPGAILSQNFLIRATK